jgi:hypothetical protein
MPNEVAARIRPPPPPPLNDGDVADDADDDEASFFWPTSSLSKFGKSFFDELKF